MISRFALALVGVHVNVLLNNCKQNVSSLSLNSLLVGTTVDIYNINAISFLEVYERMINIS